jgi:hypothetical protein
MPHPGKEASRGAESFTGQLDQIDVEFKDMVAHLTSYVFDPHKLPVKTINGNEVTVSGLLSFFESYMKVFTGGVPTAKLALEATAEGHIRNLAEKAMASYRERMKWASDMEFPYKPTEQLKEKHELARKDSLKEFAETPTLGGGQLRELQQSKLEEAIDQDYRHFVRDNEHKKALAEKTNTEAVAEAFETYNKQMKKEYRDGKEIPELKDLQALHQKHRNNAVILCKDLLNPIGGESLSNQYKQVLLDKFPEAYQTHKTAAHARKAEARSSTEKACQEALSRYCQRMKSVCKAEDPMLSQDHFDERSLIEKDSALHYFKDERKVESGSEFVQSCQQQLEREIAAEHGRLNDQNLVKEPLSRRVKSVMALFAGAAARRALVAYVLPAAVTVPWAPALIVPAVASLATYGSIDYVKRPINQTRLSIQRRMGSWMGSWMGNKEKKKEE